MRRLLTVAVLALSLLPAAPALGANYFVTSVEDSIGTPCTPGAAGTLNCTSLRRAVNEAGTNADANDSITIPAGTYGLTAGELVLASGITIVGAEARFTRITAGSNSRVIRVPAGVTEVILARLALDDGFIDNDDGGDILNQGELALLNVSVTNGIVTSGVGGGIANEGGDLLIAQSLIEDNSAGSGGGIDNFPLGPTPGTVNIQDTTLTGNGVTGEGSAIHTTGAGSDVTLEHVTLVNNVTGTGLVISGAGPQTVEVRGSIFYNNTAAFAHCGPTKPTDLGANIESADTCTFRTSGSLNTTNPQLSSSLVNAGGGTDVFTFPAGSAAENLVTPCGTVFDQRGYIRAASDPFATCDAGAYERGGQPGATTPQPTPTATATATAEPTAEPTPQPTPVATPAQTPVPTATPVAGQSVGVEPVRGTVLIKVPGSNTFIPLNVDVIKNGTEVDVRKGAVELTRTDGGVATFSEGQFKVSQTGKLTTLTLSEALDCSKRSLKAAKPKTRKLWGDGKGNFRTKGKYSAATIRGTRWLVQDTCTTTLTRVATGVVEVVHGKKKIVLRKGKSYTARAKK